MKMNAAFVFFVLFALVAGKSTTYNEKEEAIKAIRNKQNDVNAEGTKTKAEIKNEKSDFKKEILEENQQFGMKKAAETLEAFDKEIIKSIRVAIDKGKPISAIDCVVKTAIAGRDQISGYAREYNATLNNIVKKKNETLIVSELEADLLVMALNASMAETIIKINTTIFSPEGIKKEGIKKCETVINQLGEIQKRVPLPILKNEYTKVKTIMQKEFNNLLENLKKSLQKCVG